jgi:hypothetical protein
MGREEKRDSSVPGQQGRALKEWILGFPQKKSFLS